MNRYAAAVLRDRRLAVVLDQAASSSSNFLLSVTVAKFGSPVQFGVFSLAYALYWIIIVLARACGAEIVAVFHRDESDIEKLASGATAASTGLALLAVLFTGAIALAMPVQDRPVLLAFAVVLPIVVVQDGYRSVSIALGWQTKALIADTVWIIVQVAAAIVLIIASVGIEPTSFIFAWGFGGLLSLATIVGMVRIWPRVSAFRSFARSHWNLGWRFASEAIVGFGTYQLLYFVIALIAGVTATGALRGANTITSPLGVLVTGAFVAAVPDLSRCNHNHGPTLVLRKAVTYSATLAAIIIGFTIVCLSIPGSFGSAVLGATWAGARDVLLAVSVAILLNGIAVGARAGIRVLATSGRGVGLRLLLLPMSTAFALVGLLSSGLHGAAWGLVVGGAVECALLWVQFLRFRNVFVNSSSDTSTLTP